MLVNPPFGRRLCRGICPPSNPGRVPPPERAFCPLCPLPEVLPSPDPIPIPRRLRFCLDPRRGFRVPILIRPPPLPPGVQSWQSFLGFPEYRDGQPSCGVFPNPDPATPAAAHQPGLGD